MNIITELLGKRIETKIRAGWMDNYNVASGPVQGVVRTIACMESGFMLLVEQDDGWLVQITTSVHELRILDERELAKPIPLVYVADLEPGDVFKFNPVPPGKFYGKLLAVDKALGFAMPDGWDFFVIPPRKEEDLNLTVEILTEPSPLPPRVPLTADTITEEHVAELRELGACTESQAYSAFPTDPGRVGELGVEFARTLLARLYNTHFEGKP